MSTPVNPFTLASWRREVAELYAGMRNTAQRDPKLAAAQFRAGRQHRVCAANGITKHEAAWAGDRVVLPTIRP